MRLILVACAALLLAPAAQASHDWGNYHWTQSSSPFAIQVNDRTTGYAAEVAAASADWDVSTVLDVNGSGGTHQFNVENDSYGATGWIGLASIWYDPATGHILSGVVQLNDTYLLTTYSNYKQFVTCQEIGHIFGLDHQNTNFSDYNLGSCMDYTSAPQGSSKQGPNNEHPNAGDYDQLRCIYDPSVFGLTLSTSTHSCVGTGHLDLHCKNSHSKQCRKTFVIPTSEQRHLAFVSTS